ncbi:unnamed protein product [Mesocestoides corti]|uniref:Uncharacterized protein n=1 Tax=Mesocestoides corti TaxID=53468 RepID=A0A0R3UL12_MESCO|nr:unnamed protein product [Mesocestoides corti]
MVDESTTDDAVWLCGVEELRSMLSVVEVDVDGRISEAVVVEAGIEEEVVVAVVEAGIVEAGLVEAGVAETGVVENVVVVTEDEVGRVVESAVVGSLPGCGVHCLCKQA